MAEYFLRCPECRGPLVEVEGELVCRECGFVVEVVTRKPYVKEERVYEEEFSMIAVKGSFPTSPPDLRGARKEARSDVARLAKLAKRVEGSGWRFRYRTAVRFVTALAERLGLPSAYVYAALKRVRDSLKSGAADGVNTKVLAALALYDAVRSGGGRPVSLKDIKAAMRDVGFRVSNYTVFRSLMILHERGFFKSRSYSAESYLEYVVERLKRAVGARAVDWGKLLEEARSLLASLDKESVVGKSPLVLAATAVYAVWRKVSGEAVISQRIVAEAVGVSEYALRERFLKTFPQLVKRRKRQA